MIFKMIFIILFLFIIIYLLCYYNYNYNESYKPVKTENIDSLKFLTFDYLKNNFGNKLIYVTKNPSDIYIDKHQKNVDTINQFFNDNENFDLYKVSLNSYKVYKVELDFSVNLRFTL